MTRFKMLGLLGLTAVLVAAATPASAQMTWAGSLYGGYSKIMEDEAPDGSFGVRGNLFAMVDPVLGIGAELGYLSLGSEDIDPALGGGEAKASALQATAQAIARGVRGSIRPYGTLGLGLYSLKAEVQDNTIFPDDSETESKFGVNLGAGLQFKPGTSSIGFGLEAKWHTIFSGTVDENGDESALDLITVMAGINFK